MRQHSPLPWRMAEPGEFPETPGAYIVAADGKPVVSKIRPPGYRRPDEERWANGDLMLKSVNGLPKLLAALKILVDEAADADGCWCSESTEPGPCALCEARAAIAEVEVPQS
jgi:hypothetical protein